MEKKYELTNETIIYFDHILYRIKAVRNFSNVKAGDLGGFVEKEDNLSHKGDCWVYNNARVCDNAKVSKNARVCDDAIISGNAIISDYSDYIIFKNWWSSGRFFTWTRSNNRWKVGCFYGTGEELIKKAYQDSELSGREYERIVRYVESILQDAEINQLFAE